MKGKADSSTTSTSLSTKLSITDTANIKPRLIAGTNITISGTYPSLTIASTGGGGSSFPTAQSVTTGTNTTVTSQSTDIWVIRNPSATVTTDTLKMPATPVDKQIVKFSFGGTVTSGTVISSLLIQPNTSQAILGTTTFASLTPDDGLAFQWYASNSKWYRITN